MELEGMMTDKTCKRWQDHDFRRTSETDGYKCSKCARVFEYIGKENFDADNPKGPLITDFIERTASKG